MLCYRDVSAWNEMSNSSKTCRIKCRSLFKEIVKHFEDRTEELKGVKN